MATMPSPLLEAQAAQALSRIMLSGLPGQGIPTPSASRTSLPTPPIPASFPTPPLPTVPQVSLPLLSGLVYFPTSPPVSGRGSGTGTLPNLTEILSFIARLQQGLTGRGGGQAAQAGGAGGDNRQRYEPVARAAARRYGVPEEMFVRLITIESGWNPSAVSSAGAVGIAQIVPGYHPGVDPWNPEQALDYAARLLRSYYDQFGSWEAAAAAYNAGPGRVMAALRAGSAWRSQLPAETQRYLQMLFGS